ncbi:MAG: GTPase HflX, partial [Synergistaceae bacterium]|nr:GTPase HflX [Synergistaceae bacterium]
DLVAAFRATLEEIEAAELLLLVLDAGAENVAETYDVIVGTLSDIGCLNIPRVVVLNKEDLVSEGDMAALSLRFRAMGEETVSLSALRSEGFDVLLEAVEQELAAQNAWYVRY